MTPLALNDLFKLAPGPVPALMFARVVLAVGLPFKLGIIVAALVGIIAGMLGEKR